MSHKDQPAPDGVDIRLSVGVCDVFDPHDTFCTKGSEGIVLLPVRDVTRYPRHDGPSRKMRQDVMFVMISNGKGDGHHGHFPIIFFQEDPVRQTNLVHHITSGRVEFQTPFIAR